MPCGLPSQRPLRRHGLRIACGCVPRRERSLRRSSSPKKVTPRLCCSLVNALATRRLATNFFRYQADRVCVYFFQSMQCIFVERTLCNLLCVHGRGRRRCGGPTILSDRFPLVGNAHRAFRGGKRGRMPCGRSTDNHKIDEWKLHGVAIPTYAVSVRRTHVL